MDVGAPSINRRDGSVGASAVFNGGDVRGKHRLLAELKRLEQETRFLEEEIEKLDKTTEASAVCKELLPSVEGRPDPLLQETHEPVNPTWDRWFEGFQDHQICRCQCLRWLRELRICRCRCFRWLKDLRCSKCRCLRWLQDRRTCKCLCFRCPKARLSCRSCCFGF